MAARGERAADGARSARRRTHAQSESEPRRDRLGIPEHPERAGDGQTTTYKLITRAGAGNVDTVRGYAGELAALKVPATGQVGLIEIQLFRGLQLRLGML